MLFFFPATSLGSSPARLLHLAGHSALIESFSQTLRYRGRDCEFTSTLHLAKAGAHADGCVIYVSSTSAVSKRVRKKKKKKKTNWQPIRYSGRRRMAIESTAEQQANHHCFCFASLLPVPSMPLAGCKLG